MGVTEILAMFVAQTLAGVSAQARARLQPTAARERWTFDCRRWTQAPALSRRGE
jgi:hypothetical protein